MRLLLALSMGILTLGARPGGPGEDQDGQGERGFMAQQDEVANPKPAAPGAPAPEPATVSAGVEGTAAASSSAASSSADALAAAEPVAEEGSLPAAPEEGETKCECCQRDLDELRRDGAAIWENPCRFTNYHGRGHIMQICL